MNAMSLRIRSVLWGLAVSIAAATAIAAEVEKKEEQSSAEIERKLEDARTRLDAAAREVAELSMSMSDYSVPQMRGFPHRAERRAMLGINLGPRGEGLPEGVEVLSVSPGGAAEKAGLKAGDLLLAINGQPLKRDDGVPARDQLMKLMREVKPGDKVQLRYRRDKKVATASVTAQPPMDRMFAMPPAVRGRIAAGPAVPLAPLAYMRAVGVFGSAELVPMTPKLGQYFGTDKGLLVVRAPNDSRLQLEDGDVIVDIDGRTPSNPTHAFRILGSYQPGEQLKLNVLRQKKRMSFDITVPDQPSASRIDTFARPMHPPMPPPDVAVGESFMIAPQAWPPPPGEAGITIMRSIEDEPA